MSSSIYPLPLILSTSLIPGIKNNSPTVEFAIIFWSVSNLLFPDLSGIIIVLLSFILTNPFPSPLGEASAIPSAPMDEITTKGDSFKNSLLCCSNSFITLIAALPLGYS